MVHKIRDRSSDYQSCLHFHLMKIYLILVVNYYHPLTWNTSHTYLPIIIILSDTISSVTIILDSLLYKDIICFDEQGNQFEYCSLCTINSLFILDLMMWRLFHLLFFSFHNSTVFFEVIFHGWSDLMRNIRNP